MATTVAVGQTCSSRRRARGRQKTRRVRWFCGVHNLRRLTLGWGGAGRRGVEGGRGQEAERTIMVSVDTHTHSVAVGIIIIYPPPPPPPTFQISLMFRWTLSTIFTYLLTSSYWHSSQRHRIRSQRQSPQNISSQRQFAYSKIVPTPVAPKQIVPTPIAPKQIVPTPIAPKQFVQTPMNRPKAYRPNANPKPPQSSPSRFVLLVSVDNTELELCS